MKTQHALELFKIINFFTSSDKETLVLGLSLLKEDPIIKNLNKHYKCKVYVQNASDFPGFGLKPSWWNIKPISRWTVIFKKALVQFAIDHQDDDTRFYSSIKVILLWLDYILRNNSFESNKYLRKNKLKSILGLAYQKLHLGHTTVESLKLEQFRILKKLTHFLIKKEIVLNRTKRKDNKNHKGYDHP